MGLEPGFREAVRKVIVWEKRPTCTGPRSDSSPGQQGLHRRDRSGAGRRGEPDPFALLETERDLLHARVMMEQVGGEQPGT